MNRYPIDPIHILFVQYTSKPIKTDASAEVVGTSAYLFGGFDHRASSNLGLIGCTLANLNLNLLFDDLQGFL